MVMNYIAFTHHDNNGYDKDGDTDNTQQLVSLPNQCVKMTLYSDQNNCQRREGILPLNEEWRKDVQVMLCAFRKKKTLS